MLSFANATANLYNRLGTYGNLILNLKNFQNIQLPAMTSTSNGVVSELDAESDIQAIMGSSYISLLDTGAGSYGSVAQQLAVATVNRMVFRDNPQYNQTLTSTNTLASIREIIRQMAVAGATVLAQTVTATPAAFVGVGNGAVCASVRRPSDGRVLENAYAENLTLTCTGDSYQGSATAGNEPFSLTGTGIQNNLFAFNWPLGSNASTSLSAIDGNSDVSAGNLLTNSGFESWTADVPDNWTLNVGTAGTSVFEENTIVYDGLASLAMTGDGATLAEIRQQFDSDSGTAGELIPLAQYGFNLWIRRDGVAPAAGVLTVELADASTLITLQDQAGNANSFTIDLTALTTEFAAVQFAFRTPLIMPAAVVLRVRQTTPLTNGRTVYIDKAALGPMTQAGLHLPFLAVFSGSTPFARNDYSLTAVTNSRGAGGSLFTWQCMLFRLLYAEVYSNEILFPSSATPTISDNLITAP